MTLQPEQYEQEFLAGMRTDHLFHRLWTKAVGTPQYRKSEWLELEKRLLDLGRAAHDFPTEREKHD